MYAGGMRHRLAMVLTTLALGAGACRHRRAPRSRPSPAWWVAPADAPAMRLIGGETLHGSLRAHNGLAARPPHPAAPIVATARMADGSWRFAAADGSLYRADSYTAPLSPAGELPAPLELPAARDNAALQGAHSEGALVARDATLRAHLVEADGTARPLPLARVLGACAVDARTVLAVTEPGALALSRDAGRTFAPLRPPAGVALAVWMTDDGARVRTTAGTFLFRDGALAPDPADLTPARWLRVSDEVVARVRASAFAPPFGLGPGESASTDGRAVFTVRGDRFVQLGPRGDALRSERLPGDACALSPAWGGVGAVCRVGWARVILARRQGDPGWRVLRDERDAAPVGEVLFDRRSAAWATDAPCSQRPEDAGAMCLIDRDGVARAIPRAGAMLDLDDGRLVTWGDGAVLVRDERGARVTASPTMEARPEGYIARWLGAALVVLPRGGGATWAWRFAGGAWRRATLPGDGAGFTDDGAVLTWRADGTAFATSRDLVRFDPLPAPVRGAPSALDLSGAALRCVAGWCALGARVVWSRAIVGDGRALARSAAVPRSAAASPQRTIACVHEGGGPAQEIDHGAASTGYAVRAREVAPDTLAVTWEGDLLRGEVRARVPRRAGARMEVRGVPFATSPAALIARCDDVGCDHLLATRAGIADLRLGRRGASGVEVHAWPDGYVVRVDDVRDDGALVSLARTDLRGEVLARRTYALAGRLEDAGAGRHLGRDGLWIADPQGRMRFHPIDGLGDAVEAPGPTARTDACADPAAGDGELRWIHAVPVVRGPGWFLERGRWQHEQALAVSSTGVCVRAIGGGEPREEDAAREGREEREPVRSFVLRPRAGGGYAGDAWSGRRRIALRCNAIE